MGKPTITILNPINSLADKDARKLIVKPLLYKSVVWQRDDYTGERTYTIKKSCLMTGWDGTSGKFLTGLIPRVKKYCRKKGHKIKIIDKSEKIKTSIEPNLKGITFRPDQKKALNIVSRRHRGKIVFPTGTGKTIIAAGIVSMFPKLRTLFLCHTKDLLYQSAEEFNKYFKNVFILGGGNKVNWDHIYECKSPILISIDKSYYNNMDVNNSTFFDILIVDEVHHVNSVDSQYGQIMGTNLAPRRYGLTATVPTEEKQILINEGFFGPIIAELGINEGIRLGIVAKPKMNIIPVPYEVKVNKRAKGLFRNFYKYGIVKNRARNKLIVNEVINSINNDKTTLVIIERKEHGKLIQKMLKYRGFEIPFVFGDTKKEKRSEVLKGLISRKIKATICTKIWKEGINIPSLNHVINAVGLKEEKAVLQAIGRGTRVTDDKKVINVTDFLDPYKFLAEHSVLRMSIYIKKGWLK